MFSHAGGLLHKHHADSNGECTTDCTHTVFMCACNPDHVPLTKLWALAESWVTPEEEAPFPNS